MAVILSREGEEIVCRTRRKIEEVRCDICEGPIPLMTYGNKQCKYFRVMTGHRDWGNDSCESIEYRDICPGCLGKFVSEYFTDSSDTAYLEINTEYACPGYKCE